MSLRSVRKHLYVIPCILAVLFAGCMGEDDSTPKPTFSSLYTNYFANCASCHASDKDAFDDVELDMSGGKDAAYAALTSASIVYLSKPECSGQGIRIVSPSGFSNSLLKALIGNTTERAEFANANGNCNPTQHGIYNAEPNAATRSAIETWISNGAQNN